MRLKVVFIIQSDTLVFTLVFKEEYIATAQKYQNLCTELQCPKSGHPSDKWATTTQQNNLET